MTGSSESELKVSNYFGLYLSTAAYCWSPSLKMQEVGLNYWPFVFTPELVTSKQPLTIVLLKSFFMGRSLLFYSIVLLPHVDLAGLAARV